MFEAHSGRLRLPPPAFDAQIGTQTGHPSDQTAELRAAGILDARSVVHPTLRAGVHAAADPVCRLTLRIQHADGAREVHQGWISGDAAALLLAAEGGLLELVSLHPSFLPEAIARLVDLSPRPRASGAVPVRLTAQTIDALTGSDPHAHSTTATMLLAATTSPAQQTTAQALASGTHRRWEAIMTWNPAPTATGRRAIHVLDTPTGLWLLEPAGPGLLASLHTHGGMARADHPAPTRPRAGSGAVKQGLLS